MFGTCKSANLLITCAAQMATVAIVQSWPGLESENSPLLIKLRLNFIGMVPF